MYRDVVTQHRDVVSFLTANQGKTDEELLAAAKEFDSNADKEENRIGKKLDAYTEATKSISAENTKLSIELTKQSIELGLLVAENGVNIAKVAAINTTMGLFKSNDTDKKLTVVTAVMRASEQMSLLNEINALISADQEVAGSVSKLQEQLNARG